MEGLPFQRRPGVHAHARTTHFRSLRDGLASCLKNVPRPVTSCLLDLRTLSGNLIWGQGRLPGPGCGEEDGRRSNSSSGSSGAPEHCVRGVWCDVVPSGPPCHMCSACALRHQWDQARGPGRLGTRTQPLCAHAYTPPMTAARGDGFIGFSCFDRMNSDDWPRLGVGPDPAAVQPSVCPGGSVWGRM